MREFHIVEEGAVCSVVRDGVTTQSFELQWNPQRSLDLLRQINSLRSADGAPIYACFRVGKLYGWALFQELLFWEYLQPYVRYEPLLAWLRKHAAGHRVKTAVPALKKVLLMCGLSGDSGRGRTTREKVRAFAEALFLLANASFCGWAARRSGARFYLWSLNAMWGAQCIDYRLKDVYSVLWDYRVPFLEAFPFSGFKMAAERMRKSRRPALYVPNPVSPPPSDNAARPAGWAGTEKVQMPYHDLEALLGEMAALIQQADAQASFVKRLLRLANVRQIIGIDEHTTYGPLRSATAEMGIPMTGLQHGVFHKYSIGWTAPGIPAAFTYGYDKLLVWGPFWQDLLHELGRVYPKEKTAASGFIRPSSIQLKRRSRQPPPSGKFRILVPYEFLANASEVGLFIKAFLRKGWEVVFKVRFDDTLDRQLELLPKESLILAEELSQELADSVNVCAGTSSTFMYEMYYLGIPVWFLETLHDSNIHMVEKGLASKITLEMLARDDFDPHQHIIEPRDPNRIFSEGSLPHDVLRMASS